MPGQRVMECTAKKSRSGKSMMLGKREAGKFTMETSVNMNNSEYAGTIRQRKSMLFLFLISFILLACGGETERVNQMETKVDSLQVRLDRAYRPGLGEFMLGIQLHHAKLWFAGQNQNWALADFEVKEIKESLDDINEYCQDRAEVKAIAMINAPIDSVVNSVARKNPEAFKNSFELLTNSCNNCHAATGHAFNVVTIPSGLPVVNQDFKPSR